MDGKGTPSSGCVNPLEPAFLWIYLALVVVQVPCLRGPWQGHRDVFVLLESKELQLTLAKLVAWLYSLAL